MVRSVILSQHQVCVVIHLVNINYQSKATKRKTRSRFLPLINGDER
jgi:hypothetical protein